MQLAICKYISITNESATAVTVFAPEPSITTSADPCPFYLMTVMSSVLMVKVNLSLSSKVSKGMRTFKPIQNEYDSVKEARGKNVTLTHKFR